jgi:ribosomal protein S18 acetylase RimI-like enzyme
MSRPQRIPVGASPPLIGGATLQFSRCGQELMRLREVTTRGDALALRVIRNECREYMTFATEEISEAEQLRWWEHIRGNPAWRLWLVYVPDWAEAVGFGMLRVGTNGWLVTLGFRPWMRGRGLGTLLYRALAEQVVGEKVWAIIRSDNLASQRSAVKAGYCQVPWTTPGQIAMVGETL